MALITPDDDSPLQQDFSPRNGRRTLPIIPAGDTAPAPVPVRALSADKVQEGLVDAARRDDFEGFRTRYNGEGRSLEVLRGIFEGLKEYARRMDAEATHAERSPEQDHSLTPVTATRAELERIFKNFGHLELGEVEVIAGGARIREAVPEDAAGIARLYEEVWIKPEEVGSVVDRTHEKSFERKGGIFSIITQQDLEKMFANPNCVIVVATKRNGVGDKVVGVCWGYTRVPEKDDGTVPHYTDFTDLTKVIDREDLTRKKGPEFAGNFFEAMKTDGVFLGGDILVKHGEREPLAHLLTAKIGSALLKKMPGIRFFIFNILTILALDGIPVDPPMENIQSQNFMRPLMEAVLGYENQKIKKGERELDIQSTVFGSTIEGFLRFIRHLEKLYLSGRLDQSLMRRPPKKLPIAPERTSDVAKPEVPKD